MIEFQILKVFQSFIEMVKINIAERTKEERLPCLEEVKRGKGVIPGEPALNEHHTLIALLLF